MSYLVIQIWIFLLLAAIVGLIAGWLLRGSAKAKIEKVNADWTQRMANVDAEKAEITRSAEDLTTTNKRQGDMYLKLSQERDVLAQRIKEQATGSVVGSQEFISVKHQLALRTDEVGQLKEQLAETTDQLVTTQDSLQGLHGNVITPKASSVVTTQLEEKVASLTEAKAKLSAELESEHEKSQAANNSLQEAQRQLQEYEEQLKCSENTLGDVSSELQQKQEFFDVARGELDSKINLRNEDLSLANTTIKQQETSLLELKSTLESGDQTLRELTQKEAEQKRKSTLLEQQLEQTQKALTQTTEKYKKLETDLRASELRVDSLVQKASTVEPPRDYSEVSSGIMGAGAAAVVGAAAASKSDGLSSSWSKLSGMARDGYEKVKVKVEDTTTEVVNATAIGSPNDENYRIELIRSIGKDNRIQLHDMGVNTTLNLLEKCTDDTGVNIVSKALGRESWVVSSWVSIADLLRIKGIDGPMAEVLELSGVYSAKALAAANPEKLIQSIQSVNQRVEKVSSIPDIATVAGWIRHAETLKKHVA
ncbi:DUF4332 domain-containing protein [Leucothrix arctica]|uniref:DUF4332 domain-containing protein n=1 Tax=Leucothrix arctica TaxID=1481894 RepID=A0A317CRG4_9GAMM|nr:DUF4332 domain-containing protein [Leucothrix arctica]PWQ98892.1 hypothetical protein DKT75_01645 [Leucothrix arctica]